jgi:hypothetical protein
MQHAFIFEPGRWIGQGKITFSKSNDLIHFYTSWQIEPLEEGKIHCRQTVEMVEIEQVVINDYIIDFIQDNHFRIVREKEEAQVIAGKGVVDESSIAWEFREGDDVKGFEVYELVEQGDYMFHAEFLSIELFRTIVDGRIWKKSST